jgi:hypothetical protein
MLMKVSGSWYWENPVGSVASDADSITEAHFLVVPHTSHPQRVHPPRGILSYIYYRPARRMHSDMARIEQEKTGVAEILWTCCQEILSSNLCCYHLPTGAG